MDISMELINEKDLKLNLTEKIGGLQKAFLEINWGKAINNAIDSGLKMILPDFIENEIISIKDAFVKGGLKEGIKTTIDTTISKGKEVIGIFTGNLENITQAEAISKNGGLIENLSDMLECVIDKTVENDFLKEGLGELIKGGKEFILDYAEKNIDKINKEQVKKIKEMNTAIENWEEAFKNKDFKKMQNEYKKIENRIEKILPIKETLDKAEVVKNLHNLIKNNGKNFDLSDEQLKLAEQLI